VRAAAVAVALLALVLTGCESSQEKSAKLERAAKVQARNAPKGLVIAHPSKDAKVLATGVVSTSEGAAAVVTVHNETAHLLREVPIEINVRDASGASVYANTTPGLARTLVSIALLPPHATLTWVDDQVRTTGQSAASVKATVGEAPSASGALPSIAVSGTHIVEGTEGTSAEGTVTNHSQVQQAELVVYAVARRGGHIVAAGRAVLPQLAAGGSEPYRVFFIGAPEGAQLQVSAPPVSTG
jgi:hypothetical protein